MERAQRTHTEEFYEVWDLDWTVTALNRKLRVWENIYNTVRPHPPPWLSKHDWKRCVIGPNPLSSVQKANKWHLTEHKVAGSITNEPAGGRVVHSMTDAAQRQEVFAQKSHITVIIHSIYPCRVVLGVVAGPSRTVRARRPAGRLPAICLRVIRE